MCIRDSYPLGTILRDINTDEEIVYLFNYRKRPYCTKLEEMYNDNYSIWQYSPCLLYTSCVKQEDMTKALIALIQKTLKNHKRIIFSGNGYSDEWKKMCIRDRCNTWSI